MAASQMITAQADSHGPHHELPGPEVAMMLEALKPLPAADSTALRRHILWRGQFLRHAKVHAAMLSRAMEALQRLSQGNAVLNDIAESRIKIELGNRRTTLWCTVPARACRCKSSCASAPSCLQALAREAADHNITWGLEVVNRYVSNIINTAQQVSIPRMQQQLCDKLHRSSGLPCMRTWIPALLAHGLGT